MAYKMVIVMRKDLNMRKGKIAAQACHGAVNIVMRTLLSKSLNDKYVINRSGHIKFDESINDDITKWFNSDFRKICCYVESEEEILELCKKADNENINYSVIRDNGLTEFHGINTITGIVFEPLEDSRIDVISKKLPLF